MTFWVLEIKKMKKWVNIEQWKYSMHSVSRHVSMQFGYWKEVNANSIDKIKRFNLILVLKCIRFCKSFFHFFCISFSMAYHWKEIIIKMYRILYSNVSMDSVAIVIKMFSMYWKEFVNLHEGPRYRKKRGERIFIC